LANFKLSLAVSQLKLDAEKMLSNGDSGEMDPGIVFKLRAKISKITKKIAASARHQVPGSDGSFTSLGDLMDSLGEDSRLSELAGYASDLRRNHMEMEISGSTVRNTAHGFNVDTSCGVRGLERGRNGQHGVMAGINRKRRYYFDKAREKMFRPDPVAEKRYAPKDIRHFWKKNIKEVPKDHNYSHVSFWKCLQMQRLFSGTP
jgi:hypothetical protein